MATQRLLLVRLSQELKTQLEERSRKDRRTQSETLRIAIEHFVDADRREPVNPWARGNLRVLKW